MKNYRAKAQSRKRIELWPKAGTAPHDPFALAYFLCAFASLHDTL
jgi:hypothetical protein